MPRSNPAMWATDTPTSSTADAVDAAEVPLDAALSHSRAALELYRQFPDDVGIITEAVQKLCVAEAALKLAMKTPRPRSPEQTVAKALAARLAKTSLRPPPEEQLAELRLPEEGGLLQGVAAARSQDIREGRAPLIERGGRARRIAGLDRGQQLLRGGHPPPPAGEEERRQSKHAPPLLNAKVGGGSMTSMKKTRESGASPRSCAGTRPGWVQAPCVAAHGRAAMRCRRHHSHNHSSAPS